ncbi:Uncharacterised protein [Halioglobus japonicus]|nr:Uncharacterised protein [Halioglobus japonicus]
MIKPLLALVIVAMAATAGNAHAADQFAFFQCGVKLGSKYLTYKPNPEEKNKRDTRLNHVAGIANAQSSEFTLPDAGFTSMAADRADTSLAVEFRLPPKVTVASFGCSWR